MPVRPGETVGLAFRPETLSLFDKAIGPRDPHRAARGRRRMAEVALSGVTKRFGDDAGGRRSVA